MNCLNPKCNALMPEGARFCTDCGTTVMSVVTCRYCGVMNPLGSAFCVDCGKPQVGSTSQKGSMATMPHVNEFVYLLDQERLRSESTKDVAVPYGCVAISVVNGKVQKVHLQKSYLGNKDNTYKSWLKSVWEIALGATGQNVQDIKTYVMMDLRRLPMITHNHPIPIPGFQDANLHFEFWVDVDNYNNLGLFLQSFLGKRQALSFIEFKAVAVEKIVQLLVNFNLTSLASDPASAALIGADLERITGITSLCYFVKGKLGQRKHIEISNFQKPVKCPNCKAEYATLTKFCEECGSNLSNSDWASGVSYLQAAGGEQLTLRLSMLIDASQEGIQVNIDEAKVCEEVIKYLGPILRRYDVASLMKSVMLSQLSSELNTRLMRDWYGYITEFSVVDLRTTEEDWFFKTDALVAEELRKIETDRRLLSVDDSKVDLAEMAFSLVMRKVLQEDSEELSLRRQALLARTNIANVEIDEQALETQTELRKETIEDEANKQRLSREKEKILRERDVSREMTSGEHLDELKQVDHEITLEQRAAKHDIDLADMTGDAQSRSHRRDISDNSFLEDEAIRLEAKKKEQLGSIDEDLEDRKKKRRLEELRALAELEANMTAQENAHELNKAKEENSLVRQKMDAMKSMDAVQMLAMQAADLAKAGGGGQASADMIKAIAESHSKAVASQAEASSGIKVADAQAAAATAAVAMQEKMYERMLNIQKESSDSAVEAHKSAASVVQSTNEKSMENMMYVAKLSVAESSHSYKEAAKIAQSINEKSMDSMAKVASAAPSKKNTSKDDGDIVRLKCIHSDCDAVFDSKVPKFCHKCGKSQAID